MTGSPGRGSAGRVPCSPRAMRCADQAAIAASRTSSAATSPASRRCGSSMPAPASSGRRSCWPFHVRFAKGSGAPASTANETSGCTSCTRESRTRSTSRIAVRSAQPCAEVPGATARASWYVGASSAVRGGVKKTLERRGPTAARAASSARRRAPSSGKPIGTSTPTATASAKRSSSAGKRRSSTASAKPPSRSATAIQPPRAASTPSVSIAAELRPDQVPVREQEAEREEGEGGEAAEIPPHGEGERGTEGQGHQQPRQTRPQPEARRRRQEEREEHQVGQAQIGALTLAGDRKGEREVAEDVLMLRHDHLRRAAPDGVRVDPRDDQRHEHHPAERLEVLQEREADGGDAEQLAEVLCRVPAGDVEGPREHAEGDADGQQPARTSQRQHEPDERQACGRDDKADERDVPPRRGVPQAVVERVVEPERREKS